ncbi:MAG: hypothetical protein Kow0065_08320 [Methylomicrobium sp.]
MELSHSSKQEFRASLTALLLVLLNACATSRQIAVDYPLAQPKPVAPLGGFESVDGDDYYVQLMSEFELKGDNAIKAGCSEIGSGYETANTSAAVRLRIVNEPINYRQEVTALGYQAGTGKCNFNLETRKAALTPWLRLDLSKDTTIDYQFLTSNQSDTDISKIIGDVNKTTNLLALTGVGLGVAVMGKVADEWMRSSAATAPVEPPPAAKLSSETHTLPTVVQFSGDRAVFNEARLPVYEVVDGKTTWFADGPKQIGELKIYPEIRSSLLLKQISAGVPSARDVSIDELWRTPIRVGAGNVELKALLANAPEGDKPNLAPDWRRYGQVESSCRKLKLALRNLGFNKFDRNAVLYYFLTQSPDWRNYNIPRVRATADDMRADTLQQFKSRDFSSCFADEDYKTMAMMGLAVNTRQDWEAIVDARRRRESVFGPVQSIGRQLTAVLQNHNPAEMARQIYPLIAAGNEGGKVLLQNHLGEFGLEGLLSVETMPGEGIVIDAPQFETVFSWLYLDRLSCTRPALEAGKPLGNIGLLLFTTRDGSPWPKGGALEFEIQAGKIVRIAFQHPSFRDFAQSLIDYPEIGGCRVDNSLIERLR